MDNRQPIVTGPNGNPKPFTAAFSQPITSPGAADMSQPMQPVMAAQPLSTAQSTQTTTQPQGMQNGAIVSPGNVQQNPLTGAPMMMQAPVPVQIEPKKDLKSLFKTIAIVALSLVSLTFIGLFIWMFIQYDDVKTDVDGQITAAVVAAVDENTTKLENEFAVREKYPFKTFAGPADYGELTFEYPKTWSVYVAKDAHNGGDFEAYFNPLEVNEVSNEVIAALRVKILDTPFDEVAATYQGELEGEEAKMRLDSVTIGKNNDITANRYTGVIPGTEFSGIVVLFKIRDKAVIMETDSMLFEGDYNTLLSTVTFNS
ncbi:hypothetical protein IJI79_02680 [Candidatus Saccharibacteria bacterium]|nr:hypothetical protein [Candidatus Saccharibacteria bacterium]